MKSNASRILAAGCGFALALSSSASAQPAGLYLNAEGGGSWMPDTNLKSFFGADTTGAKVSFHNGARFDFIAGYQLTDWFSVEGQTGVLANGISSVTGGTTDDASYSNVPLLLNLRFQLRSRCPVTPYLGGGLGGSVAVIDADHIDFGGVTMHGTQSTAVFAYQAFGGLSYRINDQMSVGVEYHYFATTDPEWKADESFGTASDKLKFGGTETHSVSLMFEYRF